MPNLSRLGSFSTSNLPDTRDVEVKSRRGPYQRIADGSSPDLAPAARQPLAATRSSERGTAMQLRRSVSMQAVVNPGSRNAGLAPDNLQELLKQLNTLNDHVAGIKFKPDERRRQIRREVMSSRSMNSNWINRWSGSCLPCTRPGMT